MSSISEDFAAYLTAQWASVTSNTVPDTIQVMNFDRNRRIQGFKGTSTNGIVLVHRGSIQMVPLDFGYSTRTWTTSVLLFGATSTLVQQLVLDVMSIINDWEASGGGEFDTGGLVMTSFETGVFDITMEKTAVGDITFYSKQQART